MRRRWCGNKAPAPAADAPDVDKNPHGGENLSFDPVGAFVKSPGMECIETYPSPGRENYFTVPYSLSVMVVAGAASVALETVTSPSYMAFTRAL